MDKVRVGWESSGTEMVDNKHSYEASLRPASVGAAGSLDVPEESSE